MKKLYRLCAVVMLTLSLALSTWADDGHMDCPGSATQPPFIAATGEIECPGLQLLVSLVEDVLLLF